MFLWRPPRRRFWFLMRTPPPDRWKTTLTQTSFRNSFLHLETVERVSPRTGQSGEFVVIHTDDWMTVIPFTSEGKMLLVEQYRHGHNSVTLEFPAGLVHRGEDPAECAHRELREETGFQAARMVSLGTFLPNPALQSNICHAFAGLACARVGDLQLDDQEDIVVRELEIAEVVEHLVQGSFTHAVGLAAIARVLAIARGDSLAGMLEDFARSPSEP